jgi:hypothetical protein
MIYSVVPRPLAAELYDKLADYYKDEPAVEVIVDRRGQGGAPDPRGVRVERRRRRPRGSFPPIDLPSGG